MPGLIRLEWQRDPNGYAFYEFSPEALDLIELMMWSEPEQGRLAAAEGQQLRADEAASTERVWLVSTSRKLEPYSVEGTDKKICLQLANTPCTPGGAQKFVNEWGTIPLNGRQQAIQDVHEIYKCIRGMRRAAALLVGCEPMSAIERLGHSAPWMMAGFRNAWSEVERGPSVPLQLRIRRLGTAFHTAVDARCLGPPKFLLRGSDADSGHGH